jgi:hypothetical protein
MASGKAWDVSSNILHFLLNVKYLNENFDKKSNLERKQEFGVGLKADINKDCGTDEGFVLFMIA